MLSFKTNMTKATLISELRKLTSNRMSVYGPTGVNFGRMGSPLLMSKVVANETRYSVIDVPCFDIDFTFTNNLKADSGATTPVTDQFSYARFIDIQLFINKDVATTELVDLAGFATYGVDAGTAISSISSSKLPDLSNYPIDYLDTSLPLNTYFNEYDFQLYYIPAGIADISENNGVPFVNYSADNGSTWKTIYMPIIARNASNTELWGVAANGSLINEAISTGGNQPNVKFKNRKSVIYTANNSSQIICSNIMASINEFPDAYNFVAAGDVSSEIAALDARVTAIEQAIPIISSGGNYIAL